MAGIDDRFNALATQQGGESIHDRFSRLAQAPTIGQQAESFLGSAADAASLHLMPQLAGYVHSGIDAAQDLAGPGIINRGLEAVQGTSFADKALQERLHGQGPEAYAQALREYTQGLREQAPTAAAAGELAGAVGAGFAAPMSAAGGITGLVRNAAIDAGLSGVDVYGQTGDLGRVPQAMATGAGLSAGIGAAGKAVGSVARGVGTVAQMAGGAARAARPVADLGARGLDLAADISRRTDPMQVQGRMRQGINNWFDEMANPAAVERRANEANAAQAGMRQVSLRNKVDQLPGPIERFEPQASGAPYAVRGEAGVQGFGSDVERLGLLQPTLGATRRRANEIMDSAGSMRGNIARQADDMPLDAIGLAGDLNARADELGRVLNQGGVAGKLRMAANEVSGRADNLTASELWESVRKNRKKVKRNMSSDDIDFHKELEKIYDPALDAHIWSAGGDELFQAWKQAGRDYQVALQTELMTKKLIESGAANRSLSLTDMLAMAGGMAAGGPLGFATGVAMMGANKVIRANEKPWEAAFYRHVRDANRAGNPLGAQQLQQGRQAALGLADAASQIPGMVGRTAGAAAPMLRAVGATADVAGAGLQQAGARLQQVGTGLQRVAPHSGRVAALQQEHAQLGGIAQEAPSQDYNGFARGNLAQPPQYQGPVYDYLREQKDQDRQTAMVNGVRRSAVRGELPQGTEVLQRAVEAGAPPAQIAALIQEFQQSNPAFARWLRGKYE